MKNLNHIVLSIFALAFLGPLFAFQDVFNVVPVNFEVSSYGAAEFGDFDADGDLDFFVFGDDGSSNIGLIYINTNAGFTADSVVVLPIAARIADAKWADYDNDGDLDIFLTGSNFGRISRLLRNDDGIFTEQNFNFTGLEDGAMDWADYDNDGDLDFVYTGRDANIDRPLYIATNTEVGFDNSFFSPDGVERGDIEWVDFDGDGDMDLFVTGYGDNGRQAAIHRQEDGVFIKTATNIKPMTRSASDWGDFDGDGDQDLLICGSWNDGSTEKRLTLIYRNDNGVFTELNAGLPGVDYGDVKWADFDNDGDLDILLSGDNGTESITKMYMNDGAGFSEAGLFLQGVKNSAMAVGDYDGDGDVDFLLSGWDGATRYTLLYNNGTAAINNAPDYPVVSSATQEGNAWVITWDSGNDDNTDIAGLTYNLRVGTESGLDDVMASHTVPFSGKYMLGRKGNMGSQTSKALVGLGEGTYYWSVQAVDNSFIASGFSPPQSFTVAGQPRVTVVYPNGGETLSAGASEYVKFYANYPGNFSIDYTSDAAASWINIRDTFNVQDTVYIPWEVPQEQTNNYLIRVTDLDNNNISDISDNTFTVDGGATLELTAPNGGESFTVGDTATIRWQGSGVNTVNLFYSTNNGQNWIEIATFLNFADKYFNWIIPDINSAEVLVLIVDADNNSLTDQSDGVFSVSPSSSASLTLNQPQAGDYWEVGSEQIVRWTNTGDAISSLKIELSMDEGLSFVEMAQVADPSSGSFTLPVPTQATDKAMLRISDAADASVFAVTDGVFTIGDSTAPRVTSFNLPAQIPVNSPLTLQISLTDISGVDDVFLHARKGGDDLFQTVRMDNNGDDYSATIPAAQITDRGITFYVSYKDIYQNGSQTDWQSVPVVLDGGLNNPAPPPAGSDVTDYRLFSIPGVLRNSSPTNFLSINPDLRDYDASRFRWYDYDNATDQLREYPDIAPLNPGRGYLLLTAQQVVMNSGEASTVSTAKPFKINVPAGFTLIGNPFNFRIPYDSLRVSNSNATFRLWEFNGSWVENSIGLSPWKGYALWVSNATTFIIRPGKDSFSKGRNIYATQKEKEWLLKLNVSDGRSASAFHRVGQLQGADEAWEMYNPVAPPPLPGSVRILFTEEGRANDIRPLSGRGEVIPFTVVVNPDEEVTTLRLEEAESLPQDFSAFVYDEESGAVYDVRQNPEIKFISRDEREHNFRLVAGKPDFIREAAPGIEFFPERFSLSANYPNPFNPATTIRYSLAVKTDVDLSIYNTLGRRVATLARGTQEKGNYSLVWQAGSLSSGVYLIRLKAGQQQFTRRALLIK